jgi:hypothetical protein
MNLSLKHQTGWCQTKPQHAQTKDAKNLVLHPSCVPEKVGANKKV